MFLMVERNLKYCSETCFYFDEIFFCNIMKTCFKHLRQPKALLHGNDYGT